MVNSNREKLEGCPKGGGSRKVGGENVERIQDNEEDAENKCDNTSQQSWGEKKSDFVYGMKCPMKDVGVVLDDFLQSLLVMHMLVSLPEVGK